VWPGIPQATQKRLKAPEKRPAHCASDMMTVAQAKNQTKKLKQKAQANKEKAKTTINLCGANAFICIIVSMWGGKNNCK